LLAQISPTNAQVALLITTQVAKKTPEGSTSNQKETTLFKTL